MNPSRLNQRIHIEKLADTKNSLGHRQNTWIPHGKAWAHITPTKSQEGHSDNAISTSTRYTVKIRYRRDIDRKMRIQWGNKTLDIIGEPENEHNKNRYLIIRAQHG